MPWLKPTDASSTRRGWRRSGIDGLKGKGSIAIGYDADIALWDPNKTAKISQSGLHHGSDYTPYEGLEVTGWPVRTLLRGRTIALDGAPVAEPTGTYLPRRTSEAFAQAGHGLAPVP